MEQNITTKNDSIEVVLKGGRRTKRRSRSGRKSTKRKSSRRSLFSVIPKNTSQNLLVDKEYKQFGNIIPGLRNM